MFCNLFIFDYVRSRLYKYKINMLMWKYLEIINDSSCYFYKKNIY